MFKRPIFKPITEKQMLVIDIIQRNTGRKFTGYTREVASKYISENMEDSIRIARERKEAKLNEPK